jgi:hypothetical protein
VEGTTGTALILLQESGAIGGQGGEGGEEEEGVCRGSRAEEVEGGGHRSENQIVGMHACLQERTAL